MRIEYIRDGLVEEFHEGVIEKFSEGQKFSQPYYLRSCAKPLQASLLVDLGADLTEEEFALCCGSHAGEECHIEVARRILNKFDIDENLLKCGVHAPLARSMQDKMLLRGEKPSSIHNNCSGKHIGFLVCCKLMGWDMETYFEPEHPLQKLVKEKINSLCNVSEAYPATMDGCGVPISSLPRPAGEGRGEGAIPFPVTTDGCGVPILSMPLYNMLCGFINLLKYDKIIHAILNYPYIFGGENRLDTEIIEKTDGLIAKVGAGGLCVVVNVEEKDAFAVKINDCSMEARRFAVLDMINCLGWGNIEFDNKIKTLQGKIVGEVVCRF